MCVSAKTQVVTGQTVMSNLGQKIRKVVRADRVSRGFLPSFTLDARLKSQLSRGSDMVRQGRPVDEVIALSQETVYLLETKQVSFFHQRKEEMMQNLARSIASLWDRGVERTILDPISLALKTFNSYCYTLNYEMHQTRN